MLHRNSDVISPGSTATAWCMRPLGTGNYEIAQAP